MATTRAAFPGVNGQEAGSLMGRPWTPASKPVRLVKSESNVRRDKRVIPEPACSICYGKAKVQCKNCSGRGRSNFVEVTILPRGVWPQWCEECRGSGLVFCNRCFGTGEKRDEIGFHLPCLHK